MAFLWPPMLLLLLTIPVGVALYRSRERQRAARAASFGVAPRPAPAPGNGGSAGSSAARPRSTWRRRIPAACTVIGLTILVLSLARPQSVIGVPRLEGTVLLAFDVSGSMAATDLAPTRMEAAKAAALAFVADQPPSVRIGVIAFSDTGFSIQVPTGRPQPRSRPRSQRLAPERGTSLAQGILQSLAVLEADEHPPSTDYYTNGSPPPTPQPTPVPKGTYAPAIIVLISDGENTEGRDPLEAAGAAADRGVRIDTVGIGTPAGTTLEVEGFRVHTQLDEAALKAIAERTDGTYYAAADQGDLAKIYGDVGSHLVVRTEPFELTPIFASAGFLLLVIGGASSLRWFGRMP